MPSIFTTIADYQTRLDAREAAAINHLIDLWERIEGDIVADLERLITDLEKNGQGISESALYRMERYRRLLAQLDEMYTALEQEGLVEIRRTMVDAAGMGEIMAQAVAAGITGRANSLGRLPIEALTQITALAQPGGPLSKILEDAYPMAANALTKQLVSNVGRGKNPRTILAFARKQGLVAGLDHILLVSRDQSVRAFRQAGVLSYRNDPDVIAYRRMAARQTRTCPMCLALDGTEYPTDQFMPVHPQDRCLTPGQLVKTEAGDVPIENVVVGMRVMAQTGQYQKVVATSSKAYTGKAIKIKSGDKILIVTPEHKVMTQRGWVEAKDLRTDDILSTF